MFQIENLQIDIENKSVVKGLDLTIPQGEIHVIMGPNGVGKSTLAHALMASKQVQAVGGRVILDGEDLSSLSTSERARKGLFLAFQYPVAVSGLKISEYLRNLYNLNRTEKVSVSEFRKILKDKLELLKWDRSILSRYLNEGFSGGEMKRLEMLQLLIMQPKIAILDEIDSGVDVDAQKIVAEGISYASKMFGTRFLIVTHYQRLLKFLQPHRIHVMLDGKIVKSGSMELVNALEKEGYEWVKNNDICE